MSYLESSTLCSTGCQWWPRNNGEWRAPPLPIWKQSCHKRSAIQDWKSAFHQICLNLNARKQRGCFHVLRGKYFQWGFKWSKTTVLSPDTEESENSQATYSVRECYKHVYLWLQSHRGRRAAEILVNVLRWQLHGRGRGYGSELGCPLPWRWGNPFPSHRSIHQWILFPWSFMHLFGCQFLRLSLQ